MSRQNDGVEVFDLQHDDDYFQIGIFDDAAANVCRKLLEREGRAYPTAHCPNDVEQFLGLWPNSIGSSLKTCCRSRRRSATPHLPRRCRATGSRTAGRRRSSRPSPRADDGVRMFDLDVRKVCAALLADQQAVALGEIARAVGGSRPDQSAIGVLTAPGRDAPWR